MTRKFLVMAGAVIAVLAFSVSASAEGITLTSNSTNFGTFSCTSGGVPMAGACFGNDITLDVSGSGTSWTVTLTFDTTGNTNSGTAIGGVSFILTGLSFDATDVNLTQAPGGAGDWTEAAGPSSASGGGCQTVQANSICTFDTSLFSATPSNPDASPLGPGNTYVWQWTIQNQTFSGFDSNTHIQAIFGKLITSGTGCPGGPSGVPCFKETGLISSGTGTVVPEPGSLALFGTGLVGLAGVIRRRMSK